MTHTYPPHIKTPAQRKAYRAKVRKEQNHMITEIINEWQDGNKSNTTPIYRAIRDRFIITRR